MTNADYLDDRQYARANRYPGATSPKRRHRRLLRLRREAPMKWQNYPNLSRRPSAPAKNRGRVQVRIRRAFTATGAEVLSSSTIYDWTHSRRRHGRSRHGRSKTLPDGIYWCTLQALRAMCEPVAHSAAAWCVAVAASQQRSPKKNLAV